MMFQDKTAKISSSLYVGTMLLFLPISYAMLQCKFISPTYDAQYYAHVKDLCLGIQYFAIIKIRLFIRVYSLVPWCMTVLLEYIDL